MKSINAINEFIAARFHTIWKWLCWLYAKHDLRYCQDSVRDYRKKLIEDQRAIVEFERRAHQIETELLTAELESCRTRTTAIEDRLFELTGNV